VRPWRIPVLRICESIAFWSLPSYDLETLPVFSTLTAPASSVSVVVESHRQRDAFRWKPPAAAGA
jgi:hypothetical protein